MSRSETVPQFRLSDFFLLAKVEEPQCLSVSIPNAGGHDASLAHSEPALRGLLRTIRELLEAKGMPGLEIVDFIAPIQTLLSSSLWHGTEGSVVVFRSPSTFHYFSASFALPLRAVLDTRFFLKPLISYLKRIERYYVLAVSDNVAKLFHCNNSECVELSGDTLPVSLKEALGSRDFSPSLQGHVSGSSGKRFVTYHGHSAAVDDTHENRTMYCRQLAAGIHDTIGISGEPLILACVNNLFAEYQQVNRSPHLLAEHISGNPDRLTAPALHRAAQEIIESESRKANDKALSQYMDVQGTENTSDTAAVILESASEGQVRYAFIASDAEMWARIDRSNGSLRLSVGNEAPEHEELLNLIALETVRHGGVAHLLPLASMPSNKPVAALFRY
jgi:hypothetical protein